MCYDSVEQRDELERCQCLEELKSTVTDVIQVISMDESHKDKYVSKCKQACGEQKSGGIPLKIFVYM